MPAKRVKSKKAKSRKVSEEELKQLRQEFDSIDKDHSGQLDANELKIFMAQNNFAADFANLAVRLFDEDGNGQISFKEFVKFCEALSKLDKDPNLLHKMLFATLDNDNSGDLDAKEIRAFYNYFSPEPLSKEDVQNIINNLDADGNGRLSFEELMSAFQH
ncbi:hypothetical protein M9Y10_019579 [Tritrichomonas musculus]|uniref:EF-hand domain-containing protein n=1 Tax=Tritrichomonas musculus TaxID=1915356 RepID=A0ABR2HGP7_9EUKA